LAQPGSPLTRRVRPLGLGVSSYLFTLAAKVSGWFGARELPLLPLQLEPYVNASVTPHPLNEVDIDVYIL